MKKLSLLFLFIVSTYVGAAQSKVYESESLFIEQINENIYRHVSYLSTESFGKVACNGMIYKNSGEAIVFDTPTNNEVAAELLDWLIVEKKLNVKAVVIGHAHEDCMGGIASFHKRGIPSYSGTMTQEFAKEKALTIPENGFQQSLELKIGTQKVICTYLGKGHTYDNIVSYVKAEKALFGGCLIKAVGGSKGYVGEADVAAWPVSVKKVKASFPEVELVIPGHGKPGGAELLDYTIELFTKGTN